MTTYSQEHTQTESWMDLPVQVKEAAAAKLKEKRESFTPGESIGLTADDLGLPRSVLQALNFEAYIWPLPRVSDDAYCLVDFAGRGTKPYDNRIYYYKSRELAIAEASGHVRSIYQKAVAKQKRKTAIANEDVASFAALQVGDVLYSSWGYDQTNVDFFQCVGFKGKATVTLRGIAGDSSDSGGSMGGRTTPCVGRFVSGEFSRRWNNGAVSLNSFSSAVPLEYKVVAGAKVYEAKYCSSYH